jgi:hypothetical protein
MDYGIVSGNSIVVITAEVLLRGGMERKSCGGEEQQPNSKRPRAVENSIKRKPKTSEIQRGKPLSPLDRNIIIRKCNTRCRCPGNETADTSCLTSFFEMSYDKAGDYVEFCHKLGRDAPPGTPEHEQYFLQIFGACVKNIDAVAQFSASWHIENPITEPVNLSMLISPIPTMNTSGLRLEMNYEHRNEGTSFRKFKPCSIVWSQIFGFSEHLLRVGAQRIKEAGGIPASLSLQPYGNQTMHDYGATETKKTFAEFFPDEGNVFLYAVF